MNRKIVVNIEGKPYKIELERKKSKLVLITNDPKDAGRVLLFRKRYHGLGFDLLVFAGKLKSRKIEESEEDIAIADYRKYRRAVVEDFRVRDEYKWQRLGVGEMCREYLIKQAEMDKFEKIAFPLHEQYANFYEKRGFREKGEKFRVGNIRELRKNIPKLKLNILWGTV